MILASDAGRWAVVAASALLLAGGAWLGDHRRTRRREVDRVGLMPWTDLFFFALLIGAIAAVLAIRLWLAPV